MTEPMLRVLLVEDNLYEADLILHEVKRANNFQIISERVDTEDQFKHALHTVLWDVILCDYSLPRFSAERAVELVEGYRLETPIIVISGAITQKQATQIFGKHRVYGYVDKNDLSPIGAMIRREVELSRRYDGTFDAWMNILGKRNQETKDHSKRVTDLTVQLAQAMKISEIEIVDIRRGALLHDIGKIGVSDAVLLKVGKLTNDEMYQMRKHPQIAYDVLSDDEWMKHYIDIPFCHHEHWDGSGYPRGLKGEEIPLAARIFAVVDVYDAMTSDRPYRKALSVSFVLKYISEQSGKLFDPVVVGAFLKMFTEVLDA